MTGFAAAHYGWGKKPCAVPFPIAASGDNSFFAVDEDGKLLTLIEGEVSLVAQETGQPLYPTWNEAVDAARHFLVTSRQ